MKQVLCLRHQTSSCSSLHDLLFEEWISHLCLFKRLWAHIFQNQAMLLIACVPLYPQQVLWCWTGGYHVFFCRQLLCCCSARGRGCALPVVAAKERLCIANLASSKTSQKTSQQDAKVCLCAITTCWFCCRTSSLISISLSGCTWTTTPSML